MGVKTNLNLYSILLLLNFLLFPHASDADSEDVFIKVLDVGQGLSCVVSMPGSYYMVYDAGGNQSECVSGIRKMIPVDEHIDLLVISHTDNDHCKNADEILSIYQVDSILFSRFTDGEDKGPWDVAYRWIQREPNCELLDVASEEVSPGWTREYGDVKLTMLAGWGEIPSEWSSYRLDHSEKINGVSIVLKLEYRNRSILFSGDTVGRHRGANRNQCIGGEKFLCDKDDIRPIRSDILIAPHHGADNASSMRFIQMVQPLYVIFSAGRSVYDHPRATTGYRYEVAGIDLNKVFRTDLGDDEGRLEWDLGRIQGHKDRAGDDDVEILLFGSGEIPEVRYSEN